MKSVFHLAYHVHNLDAARLFYGGLLGCKEGRSTDSWVDFNFFNHQISLHLGEVFKVANSGKVGDHMVPMPHLGVVLEYDNWAKLATKLENAKVDFVIRPSVRFEGKAGEQWTMFFYDPSGNPIEIKGFKNFSAVFEN